jgi:hypothetical protein
MSDKGSPTEIAVLITNVRAQLEEALERAMAMVHDRTPNVGPVPHVVLDKLSENSIVDPSFPDEVKRIILKSGWSAAVHFLLDERSKDRQTIDAQMEELAEIEDVVRAHASLGVTTPEVVGGINAALEDLKSRHAETIRLLHMARHRANSDAAEIARLNVIIESHASDRSELIGMIHEAESRGAAGNLRDQADDELDSWLAGVPLGTLPPRQL